MANRHLARSIVLQTLFAWDASGCPEKDVPSILEHTAKEFGSEDTDIAFMEALLKGVLAKRADIDLVLTKAAPEWPIERIAPIDRNILRIGLYELLFSDRKEVPPKVAINEAIELAKVFGGDSSSRFINGVLGAVYKEMGEPGKQDHATSRVISKELPREELGGAIVYAKHEGQYYIALVHDVFGKWTLSKGGLSKGESIEEGTVRVVEEEIGIAIKVEEKIGENEYFASHPELGKVRKHVSYFLASAPFEPIHLATGKTGLDDARWFRLNDILALRFYEDMTPIITEGVQKLLDRSRTT